jgi:glycosyltransferase involved in cell wall biosynthesis
VRIAVSGLVTPPQARGVGRYLAGLLGGFAALDHDDEITVHVGLDCPAEILAVRDDRIRFAPVPLRHDPRLVMRPLFLVWQQFRPVVASADVLHVPNLVPVLGRRMPTVTTVHDLVEWTITDKYSAPRRLYRRTAARAVARWSDRILVPTRRTRDDVTTFLGLDPSRVAVAPFGVDRRFTTEVPPVRSPGVASDGSRYLLYVGSDLAHKNLANLLRAAEAVLPARGVRLVLAGVEPTSPSLAPHDGSWVQARGRVDDDELRALYGGAVALVFPSLAEGFGLPVLEAFASGCPVLTSTGTACGEVAGDAAFLVDPADEESIARGMARLLDDPELRTRLTRAGLARAAEFTWERCAELTREAYVEAVAAHRGGRS